MNGISTHFCHFLWKRLSIMLNFLFNYVEEVTFHDFLVSACMRPSSHIFAGKKNICYIFTDQITHPI